MAALIRKANSWYKMANKPKIKKERMYGGKKKKKNLSEKKDEARNGSEQRDKGWIHIIHGHDTTHLAEQQILTNYPTQRKTEQSH